MDNSSLELYHRRLDKRPNSITLRIRHAALRCAALRCAAPFCCALLCSTPLPSGTLRCV